jgi:hypothetical protein
LGFGIDLLASQKMKADFLHHLRAERQSDNLAKAHCGLETEASFQSD